MNQTKICTKCKLQQDINNFRVRATRNNQLFTICKSCQKQQYNARNAIKSLSKIKHPLDNDLIFKDIHGYEGIYKITNYGTVWSYAQSGKLIKPYLSDNKYHRVTLSKDNKPKIFFVHRLVAYTYMIKPEGKTEINHIDGNKLNNHISNLEWCTSSENQKHAFRIGLQVRKLGSDNPSAKKVECINTGIIFDTLTLAAIWGNTDKSCIMRVCKNKLINGYLCKSAGTHPVTGEKLNWRYYAKNT